MTLDDIILIIIFPVLGLAIILASVRLALGPSLADRIVAIDLLTAIAIGVTAVYAIARDDPVILDVAVVLALISFLGTVAFARYLQTRR